jgi:hypothetical protein
MCSIPYGIIYFMIIQFLRKIENQKKKLSQLNEINF